MRIGEIAALAGVSTRAVRYYHRVGVLPEPGRRRNGYREYGMREAVELVRVRRLVELGLGLDEVREVVRGDAGKDLRGILAGLDADLARQEEDLRRRRAVLAGLLERADAAEGAGVAETPGAFEASGGGGLAAEGPVSEELAAVFEDMARVGAERGGVEPVLARKDRELMATLEASARPGHGEWLATLKETLTGDPKAMARAYEVYERFDELADAERDDPRVQELADELVDVMAQGPMSFGGGREADSFAEALFADFPPAQEEALRRAAKVLRERARS